MVNFYITLSLVQDFELPKDYCTQAFLLFEMDRINYGGDIEHALYKNSLISCTALDIMSYDIFRDDKILMDLFEEEIEMYIKIQYTLMMQKQLVKGVYLINHEYCISTLYKDVELILKRLDGVLRIQYAYMKLIRKQIKKRVGTEKDTLKKFKKKLWKCNYSKIESMIFADMAGNPKLIARKIIMKVVEDIYKPIILNNRLECLASFFFCIIVIIKEIDYAVNGRGRLRFPFDNW